MPTATSPKPKRRPLDLASPSAAAFVYDEPQPLMMDRPAGRSEGFGFVVAPGHDQASVVGAGMDAYLRQVHEATPMQLISVERQGMDVAFISDLAKRMGIAEQRFFNYLRIPKATAQRKKANKAIVDGHAGQTALGMARLAAMAQDMVKESTASQAQGFDALRWLGQWIERPQPALGGQRPADLLDTPTGMDMVSRLLGAVQSGAYQ
jgi:putative toxin-antitoxin system antitoxin component (TIGR02293 family)